MIVPIVSCFFTTLLTIFATAIMSYIAMATPVGPWIAPSIVLIALVIFKCIPVKDKTSPIALIASSASVGGIIATACGFSFPTLYFAAPSLFMNWMESPLYFASALGGLVLVAGAYGIWIANMAEEKLLVVEKLDFPIGQLVYKMIAATQQLRKSYELLVGFFSSLLFSVLQQGIAGIQGIIPASLTLFQGGHIGSFAFPALRFDFAPLFWAVGFIAGPVIAAPLLVGSLSKLMVVDPCNAFFFSTIANSEFLLAFCSGMVIASAAAGILDSPVHWYRSLKAGGWNIWCGLPQWCSLPELSRSFIVQGILVIGGALFFLSFWGFGFVAQGYLLITTAVCTYQMAVIAGKIGLAQLGRWATFVMVPALFLFNLNVVQIVFIATFVEISGGVACDILFGRKIAQLSGISRNTMKLYQYAGLIITALCIGIIFWLLISHFPLGSEHLFAQRAQARQLLLAAQSFNVIVLLVGFVFGYLLKLLKFNPMLVLGGLLMPLHLTISLVFGGALSLLVADKDEYVPFWSGVFAAGSLYMVFSALV